MNDYNQFRLYRFELHQTKITNIFIWVKKVKGTSFDTNKSSCMILINTGDIDSNHIRRKTTKIFIWVKKVYRICFNTNKTLCMIKINTDDIDSNHIWEKQLRYLSEWKKCIGSVLILTKLCAWFQSLKVI